MRGALTKALVLGTLGLGTAAAVAIAAPTSTVAPSISGTPSFGSVLTCNQGTWSPDAVSFDYSWTYSGGGPTIATGQTLKVPDTLIGYAIVCVVTAHDAQGATTSATSPAVTIGNGVSTVRITRAKVKKSLVTFTAVGGPAPALVRTTGGKPYAVLDRRVNKTTVLQVGSLSTIRARSGKFTISGHDSPGRHTYIVRFIPAPGSGFGESDATRTLRVK